MSHTFYNHVQSERSLCWRVRHHVSQPTSIKVYVPDNNPFSGAVLAEVRANIEYVDENNFNVHFDEFMEGEVHVSSRIAGRIGSVPRLIISGDFMSDIATIKPTDTILTLNLVLNPKHVPDYELPLDEQIVVDQTEWAKSWLIPNCSRLGNNVQVAVYLPEHTGQMLYLTTDYRESVAEYYGEGLYLHFKKPQIGRVIVTRVIG